MSDIELKDFQDETSFDLFDRIYQLGREAYIIYGEKELADFILTLAYQYKTKMFELETRRANLLREQAMEELRKQVEDSAMSNVDFSKLDVQ